MKKSIATFLIFAFFTAACGQETNITIPEITKAEYLKKSKKQKTTAWVLLGAGSLSLLLASIEVNPDYGESTNRAFLAIGGLVMIVASVPTFTASARNKKRGMSMSFKNDTVPRLRHNTLSYSSIPSISLKLGF